MQWNATARPLVGVYLPIMQPFMDEAQIEHEWKQQVRKAEHRPIDEICVDQNLPTYAREWVYQKEGLANRRLAAVVTCYVHEAMMCETKQFYSSTALGKMFKIPPATLMKLLSGKKYMGGAELEKYHAEMERQGVEIPKRKERKTGGWKMLEAPTEKQQQARTSSEAMVH